MCFYEFIMKLISCVLRLKGMNFAQFIIKLKTYQK